MALMCYIYMHLFWIIHSCKHINPDPNMILDSTYLIMIQIQTRIWILGPA